METIFLIIGIYLIGCILAGLLELLHLKLLAKRFIIPNFKKYWIGYLLFFLTSWVGFLTLAVTMIIAWIRKIY